MFSIETGPIRGWAPQAPLKGAPSALSQRAQRMSTIRVRYTVSTLTRIKNPLLLYLFLSIYYMRTIEYILYIIQGNPTIASIEY